MCGIVGRFNRDASSVLDAGLGNRALVAEGYATMPAYGTYRLVDRGGHGRAEL